jgi:hypothetical protein
MFMSRPQSEGFRFKVLRAYSSQIQTVVNIPGADGTLSYTPLSLADMTTGQTGFTAAQLERLHGRHRKLSRHNELIASWRLSLDGFIPRRPISAADPDCRTNRRQIAKGSRAPLRPDCARHEGVFRGTLEDRSHGVLNLRQIRLGDLLERQQHS